MHWRPAHWPPRDSRLPQASVCSFGCGALAWALAPTAVVRALGENGERSVQSVIIRAAIGSWPLHHIRNALLSLPEAVERAPPIALLYMLEASASGPDRRTERAVGHRFAPRRL